MVVGDRDLGVVALHRPAAGAVGHQPAVGIGDVDRPAGATPGTGVAVATVATAFGLATQIDRTSGGLFLGACQGLLGPRDRPAGFAAPAGRRGAADPVQIDDALALAVDPSPLVADRVHPGRRDTPERLAGLDSLEVLLGTGPVGLIGPPVLGILAAQLIESLLDVGGPATPIGEPRRQVVIGSATTGGNVLGVVDLSGLGHDRLGDPTGLLTHASWLRLAAREAFAAILVPSMDTTPTLTIPAAAHSRSTWVNTSANPSSCSVRNRAIVVWSGASWPHSTRNAT